VGIERGFQQAEIAKEAYEQARLIESGERVIVGVNKFQEAGPVPIKLTKVDPKEEERQIARVKKVKKERDNKAVKVALARIKKGAKEGINLFPAVLDAVKVYATMGEICDELRSVYGEYQQPSH
jgi:methylmalonyl-CoA mutase N-terminal domain/subunit